MLSVIVDVSLDPARNLALDEALARVGADGPLLWVWSNAPCVTVGRSQRVGQVVDLAACARDGVRVLRRAGEGGAVYTDPGSLNLTLVDARPGPRPDLDELMATAVEGFGLPAVAVRGGISHFQSGQSGQSGQPGWRRIEHTMVAGATVRVTTSAALAREYLATYDPDAEPVALFEHGVQVTVSAVRDAVIATATEWYGSACARRPNATERAWQELLFESRYRDPAWHLTGIGDAEGFRGGWTVPRPRCGSRSV